MKHERPPARPVIRGLLAMAAVAIAGCPASGSGSADGGLADVGGPVAGPVDGHCWLPSDGGSVFSPQPVQWFSCALADGGGCSLPDGGPCPAFGPTNADTEANDDDCKYQVGWWSTPIQYNPGGAGATCDSGPCVTFFVSAKYAADGTPMVGNPAASGNDQTYAEIEADSGNGLPPPNAGQATTKQVAPGVYQIGPFALNAHGQWQVRFHFNGECGDSWAGSPHGHAAFFLDVP